MTRSRAGIAAARQLSSVVLPACVQDARRRRLAAERQEHFHTDLTDFPGQWRYRPDPIYRTTPGWYTLRLHWGGIEVGQARRYLTVDEEAERAAVQAEALHATGRLGGADVGNLAFRRYVDEVWFPHHVLEPSTREGYWYTIDKHLMPFFGAMKTNTILPSHVREWVSDLVAAGASPATIRHTKIVLSAIFTTALNDGVVQLHPCRGVKTPTVPRKVFRIATPEQFDAIYAVLPDEQSRLLVEVAIDSGLRWGELTELRAGDLNPTSRILIISRGRDAEPEVPPRRRPLSGQALPEEQAVAAIQAQRPRRAADRGLGEGT